MQTIFLLVGGRIKTTQARIVGKIAEVQTPYGIREFGVWYETHADAKLAADRKVLRKVAEDNVEVRGGGAQTSDETTTASPPSPLTAGLAGRKDAK